MIIRGGRCVSDPHLLICGSGSWSQLFYLWIRIRMEGDSITHKKIQKYHSSLILMWYCSFLFFYVSKPSVTVLRIRAAVFNADPCGSGSETLGGRLTKNQQNTYLKIIQKHFKLIARAYIGQVTTPGCFQ